MSVPGYSVRNRVTMTMLYTLVIAFGIFSFSRLQIDLYPDMEIPYIVVMTTYLGTTPEDIETLISRPMEEAAVSVTGVKNVTSTSKENISIVALEFDWGYDMDKAETDTRRKVELVVSKLPEDANAPLIVAMDPAMMPIVFFNLIGNYSISQLRKIAEDRIKPKLERVPGISSIEIAGGELREIHVKLKPDKLQAYNISPTTIVQMIKAENAQVVGGYLETTGMDFSIQSTGKFRTVDEIGEILISAGHNDMGAMIPIRLGDVATVEDSIEEGRRIIETDGVSSILILVNKQSGSNSVDAARNLFKALPEVLAAEDGLDYRVVNNSAEFIEAAINNLFSTSVIAIVIVFFVLMVFFQNFRTSLIVATAIPTSIMATFGVMAQFGMTLNVISMAGLALAVGMLVDNAIVVLENIFRHRENGESAFQSAVLGAKEVILAITASTLTTIAVFFPILFVPGIAGILFRDMAIIICVALVISLVVAVTFVPMLAYYLLKNPKFDKIIEKSAIRHSSVENRRISSTEIAAITREDEAHTVTGRMRDTYEGFLVWCLRHRLVVTIVVVTTLGLSVLAGTQVPLDFMASSDNSMLTINVKTEVGNAVDEAYRVIDECADIIREIIPENERRMLTIDVGSSSSGFGALFSGGVHEGKIRVPLVKPKDRTRSLAEITDEVREGLKNVPGITYTVAGGGGPGGGAAAGDIIIEVYDDDVQKTRRITQRIKAALDERPDISDVTVSMEEQKPQIYVEFDRQKMTELGLTTSLVGNLITIYFRGVTASYYLDGGDEYDIVVRYDRAERGDIAALENMPIQTNTGAFIPLSTIAKVSQTLSPTTIERKNQRRFQSVSITLKNDFTGPDGKKFTRDMKRTIDEVSVILDNMVQLDRQDNAEWVYAISGTADDFSTSIKFLGLALVISVFLVYMVMASQFESYGSPFIVLFSVPLGLIGVLFTFYFTGRTLDMSGIIGIIMLVGIVVNNGIVLVDAANQNRERGMSMHDAIVYAGRIRMRPILMTMLTTVLAMVPLALKIGEGSETWSGMGTAVFGGLLVATIFTLFFIPIMYTVFAPKKFVMPEYEEERDVIDRSRKEIMN